MYSTNRSGPTTVLWGTLWLLHATEDITPLNLVYWAWSVKKSENYLTTFPLKPHFFLINKLHFIVSKALLKPRNQTPIFFSLNTIFHLETTAWSALSQLCFFCNLSEIKVVFFSITNLVIVFICSYHINRLIFVTSVCIANYFYGNYNWYFPLLTKYVSFRILTPFVLGFLII